MPMRLDVNRFMAELGALPGHEWPAFIAPVCRGELILTRGGADLAPFELPTVVRNHCGIPSPLPPPPEPIVDGNLMRAPGRPEVYAYWGGRRHWIVAPEVAAVVFGGDWHLYVREVPAHVVDGVPDGLAIDGPDTWALIRGGRGELPLPEPAPDPDEIGEWLGVKSDVEREWSLLLGNMITRRNYLAGTIQKVAEDISLRRW